MHEPFAIMMEDTVTDRDSELAMLVAMTGASVKQASDALHESGGDVDEATTYLNKVVSSNLEKAATISKKTQSTSVKTSGRHRREEDVDEELATAKPNIDPRYTRSPKNPKAARAHPESLRYSPAGRASRAMNKEYMHYKMGKILVSNLVSLCLSNINVLTLACSNSWRRQRGRYYLRTEGSRLHALQRRGSVTTIVTSNGGFDKSACSTSWGTYADAYVTKNDYLPRRCRCRQ
jgi:hypothetical protein